MLIDEDHSVRICAAVGIYAESNARFGTFKKKTQKLRSSPAAKVKKGRITQTYTLLNLPLTRGLHARIGHANNV